MNLRGQKWSFQMISNEPDFWFEGIRTNSLRDRARESSTKSLESPGIHQILVVFDVKCYRNVILCYRNQSLSFAKAKHIITNAQSISELNLMVFDEIVLGAPF